MIIIIIKISWGREICLQKLRKKWKHKSYKNLSGRKKKEKKKEKKSVRKDIESLKIN